MIVCRRLLASSVVCLLGFGVPVAGWAQNAPAVRASVAETTRHEFVYHADNAVKSVAVAGTFNHWDRTANPMVCDADGKTWRVTVTLPLGKTEYKFVTDGETWRTDPGAKSEDDGNGHQNSVLLLLPADYARPASPIDGITARSALRHPSSIPFLNYDRGKLTVSLQTRADDLKQVFLQMGSRRIPMTVATTDEMYARYTAQIDWDRKRDMAYTFALIDGTKTLYFGASGAGDAAGIKPFRLNARTFPTFAVPAWVEKTVFYQIFPDRFANGETSNDPPNVQLWDATPTFGNRFGGDAVGVGQHLSYLTDLGIGAVYFNPVFQSPSNHRYDTEDYKTVDGQFGTNAEFAALTKAMAVRHIRTVMDFVFNHTSPTFAPFADIVKNGPSSVYKDWYYINSYPVVVKDPPNYVGWNGYSRMPKLNLMNPPTHDYMLGLVDYWTKEIPLAGLRLDVANEVDMRFWRDLRKRVKGIDKETWIVGEQWGDGTPWLTGDQWDSKMNYEFLWPNRDFFADGKITPTEYTRRLMDVYNRYAPQVSRNMMNLLSSHDTPRFLTLCKNNEDMDRLAADGSVYLARCPIDLLWRGAGNAGRRGPGEPGRHGMEPCHRRESDADLLQKADRSSERKPGPAVRRSRYSPDR